MEEALRAILAGDSGVAALVGNRIQWTVREGSPSIALHLISQTADSHLKGRTSLAQARVQIDCWADTFLGAKAIGDAVVAALPVAGSVESDVRFKGCTHLETDRGRFGDAPNILHRTRIDLRVSTSPI